MVHVVSMFHACGRDVEVEIAMADVSIDDLPDIDIVLEEDLDERLAVVEERVKGAYCYICRRVLLHEALRGIDRRNQIHVRGVLFFLHIRRQAQVQE
jgi:hypothetical protein